MKEYNLHRGDYFGQNDKATEKYNKEFVPLLGKLGITKEKDLDKIFNVVDDIVSEACINAANEAICEEHEYD